VAQNNAAFADHPSQGTMTVERVLVRERAPWFDPEDFLLFLDGGELVASCWTKVRHRAQGDVGEIHVVSVAPSAQGRGLGRLAVLRGLDHLWRRGLGFAELYVEDTNRSAVALYEALGFTLDARVVELRYGE
jgi:mycothiol synthase